MRQHSPHLPRRGYAGGLLLKAALLAYPAHHGHSRISLPERFADFRANILQPGQRYLPLRVRLISGRLYALQDCSPENVVPAGAEIQAINGLAVPALLKAMRRYIPADGRNTTFKDYQLYEYYNFHFLYQLLHPEAASFTLKLRGARQSVRVSGQAPAQLAQVYQQRAGKSLSYFDKPLVYQATLAPGVGYVKAGSFYKGFVENFKTPFEPFIDSVLADVQRRGTRHVILDLRGNEGGGDGYAEYLFARLTNQPFQGPGHDRVAGRRFTTLPYLRNASDDIKAFLANPNQFLRNDTTLLLKPEYAGDAPQQPAAGQPYLGPLYVLTNGGTFSAVLPWWATST
ncbi:S41 family peptidase, partial [Hymenobacter sp. AT01-02]|uniref:S41 family peptidase n=1 Tax=Hymenobacter sp. AT01-02 TaxID=1571877 RepID=UPI000A4E440F